MKKYQYYIVFYHSKGIGNILWQNPKKIRTWNDLETIKNQIEQNCKLENVVIINWKQMRK